MSGEIIRINSVAPKPMLQDKITKLFQFPVIRVSCTITIPSGYQSSVSVTVHSSGTYILVPKTALFRTKRILLANGVAEVQSGVPFSVLVTNYGDFPVRLPKGFILGQAKPLTGPMSFSAPTRAEDITSALRREVGSSNLHLASVLTDDDDKDSELSDNLFAASLPDAAEPSLFLPPHLGRFDASAND